MDMTDPPFDVAVVGAGIVGLATAMALARHAYRRASNAARDAAAALLDPAVWRLSARYGRVGAGEIVRAWSRGPAGARSASVRGGLGRVGAARWVILAIAVARRRRR